MIPRRFVLFLLLSLCWPRFAATQAAVDVAPAHVDVLPVPPEEIRATLAKVYEKYRAVDDGIIYNPYEAPMSSNDFGIALVDVSGRVFVTGDSDKSFPIQSLVKLFVYGLALEDNGTDAMLRRVGVNATGLPYDSLIASSIRSQKVQNPMVSAGAMATMSLIRGDSQESKWTRVAQMLARYAGGELRVNEQVYRAEMENPHLLRALANSLASFGLFYDDVESTIARYLKATSLNVSARELAIMGATLANAGANPLTGQRAIESDHVQDVLSAMTIAGMYDASGDWLTRVGLPAKSGVGGGVVAVAPARFAIAVFSPPLDSHGNSVRGTRVLRELSLAWRLHIFAARANEN